MISSKIVLRTLVAMALTMVGTARAEWALNLPKGVTQISHEVYDLHMIVMWICVVIGIGVFGVMFYSIAKHRKSKGVVPAHFHESTAVEVAWTVIPFVILIAIAIPATKTLVNLYNSDDADMTIKVTGYQWKWHYEYLDGNVAFYSQLDSASNAARQLGSGIDPKTVENYLLNVDKPLVIPAGKKVRFLVTANDVIHAWWVPAIGWKIDAVPGFVNEMWTKVDQPGTYRGQCAELCGKDHGFMPVVVEVKPEAEYHTWLAAQQGEGANTRVAVAN